MALHPDMDVIAGFASASATRASERGFTTYVCCATFGATSHRQLLAANDLLRRRTHVPDIAASTTPTPGSTARLKHERTSLRTTSGTYAIAAALLDNLQYVRLSRAFSSSSTDSGGSEFTRQSGSHTR